MKPRFHADAEGFIVVLWNAMNEEVSLERCWDVPIMRYVVLEGLTVSRFEMNQA
jgi:hypothetical protein